MWIWYVTEEQRSQPGCVGREGERLCHSRALSYEWPETDAESNRRIFWCAAERNGVLVWPSRCDNEFMRGGSGGEVISAAGVIASLAFALPACAESRRHDGFYAAANIDVGYMKDSDDDDRVIALPISLWSGYTYGTVAFGGGLSSNFFLYSVAGLEPCGAELRTVHRS
jgi:hypothetical protein